MNVAGWRAWYTAGRVFDSLTTTPAALPTTGVQVVVLYFDQEYAPGKPYRRILMGTDRYFYVHSGPQAGTWDNTDQTVAQVQNQYGRNRVYVWSGEWVADDVYQAISATAMQSEVL